MVVGVRMASTIIKNNDKLKKSFRFSALKIQNN